MQWEQEGGAKGGTDNLNVFPWESVNQIEEGNNWFLSLKMVHFAFLISFSMTLPGFLYGSR